MRTPFRLPEDSIFSLLSTLPYQRVSYSLCILMLLVGLQPSQPSPYFPFINSNNRRPRPILDPILTLDILLGPDSEPASNSVNFWVIWRLTICMSHHIMNAACQCLFVFMHISCAVCFCSSSIKLRWILNVASASHVEYTFWFSDLDNCFFLWF